MRIELVAVGREILSGRVHESNTHWIAQHINAMGHRVDRITILDDVEKIISKEVESSISINTDFLICTGGLGPTFDDITLKALAMGAGLELTPHREAFNFVSKKYEEYFNKGLVPHPTMTPEREKMAHLPRGARMIYNREGAAPGAIFEQESTTIIALPGPPREMQPMFTASVQPLLADALGKKAFMEKTIQTDCTDESVLTSICKKLTEKIEGLHAKTNPTYFGDKKGLRITLSIWHKNQEECDKGLSEANSLLLKRLKK